MDILNDLKSPEEQKKFKQLFKYTEEELHGVVNIIFLVFGFQFNIFHKQDDYNTEALKTLKLLLNLYYFKNYPKFEIWDDPIM